VPIGACSAGFSQLYVDGDGDSFGAGAQLAECRALAPGLSDNNDDCDDNDATVHSVVTGARDVDGDGYTARFTLCTDGTPPPDAQPADVFAPVLAAPRSTTLTQSQQATALVYRDGVTVAAFGGATPLIEAGGFQCATPLSAVQRLEVHVVAATSLGAVTTTMRVRVTENAAGRTVEAPVQLGAALGDVFVENDDTDGRVFGLSLAPADVCGGFITVQIDFPDIDNATLTLDSVELRAYGADDCDDGDPALHAPALLGVDADGDGAGEDGVLGCIETDALVAGTSPYATDCDDTDGDVFPGQQDVFFVPALNGGFDYDCSGVEETNVSIYQIDSCTDGPSGQCLSEGSFVADPPCGAVVQSELCFGAPCAIQSYGVPVLCR
jgi:hypothetical protein